jgi:hypothetical protein
MLRKGILKYTIKLVLPQKSRALALHDHSNYLLIHVYVHVNDHDHDHSILLIQVDRLNPVETSESSNSRPKGFSVSRGQGYPWSME